MHFPTEVYFSTRIRLLFRNHLSRVAPIARQWKFLRLSQQPTLWTNNPPSLFPRKWSGLRSRQKGRGRNVSIKTEEGGTVTNKETGFSFSSWGKGNEWEINTSLFLWVEIPAFFLSFFRLRREPNQKCIRPLLSLFGGLMAVWVPYKVFFSGVRLVSFFDRRKLPEKLSAFSSPENNSMGNSLFISKKTR